MLSSPLNLKILKLADHCVKCGLCSSQCPTYRLKQDENESPRGRIALAQALASEAIPVGNKISSHLNNCLQCRQCEISCPSEVKYGELIHLTHELLRQKTLRRFDLKAKIIAITANRHHASWQKIRTLWNMLARSGLLHALRIFPSARLIPSFSADTTPSDKAAVKTRATVKLDEILLFTGCLSHLFDQRALNACINLLKHCGYHVNIPRQQVCCGAVAAREGLPNIAQQCASKNSNAFFHLQNKPIVFFTPGCGSQLKEYDDKTFVTRVTNISEFLLNSHRFARLEFSTLKKRVLIFTPCSERNALQQTGLTENLLKRIPDINIITLPKNTGCCGASGSHLFTHHQQATQIRAPLIEIIASLAPDIIVSPNYPCNLHLSSGMKEKNLDIPVTHPIELLFNQINIIE